jgi:hypothetical protein
MNSNLCQYFGHLWDQLNADDVCMCVCVLGLCRMSCLNKHKEGVNPNIEALQLECASDSARVAHMYAKILTCASRNLCHLGVDCINRAVLYYLPQVCQNDIRAQLSVVINV